MSKIFEEMDRLAEQKALQEQQTQEDEMVRPKCTANITSSDCHAKNGDECMTDMTTCQHREPPHRETRKENERMKTTGLNIIEAVKAAKEGKKIKRKNCDTLWRCVENGHLMSGNVIFSPPADEYLDNDWEIYPEPPKTMTWNEALELLEAGKKVRRLAWDEGTVASLTSVGTVAINNFKRGIALATPTVEDYKRMTGSK